MTLEKLKRLTASFTAAAVVLLVFLLAVMIYQMASINARKTKIDDLKAEIAQLENENAQTRDDIDIWLNDWKIKERARELGFKYATDK